MHTISHVIVTDSLPNSTSLPSNPLLDLNLNMNLNPETTVHDNMYNVKYPNFDNLHEPVLFKPIRQVMVSPAMCTVTSFINFGPYLQSFNCLEHHQNWLKEQLTDIVTNSSHRIMEGNLSKVIYQTQP